MLIIFKCIRVSKKFVCMSICHVFQVDSAKEELSVMDEINQKYSFESQISLYQLSLTVLGLKDTGTG